MVLTQQYMTPSGKINPPINGNTYRVTKKRH